MLLILTRWPAGNELWCCCEDTSRSKKRKRPGFMVLAAKKLSLVISIIAKMKFGCFEETSSDDKPGFSYYHYTGHTYSGPVISDAYIYD